MAENGTRADFELLLTEQSKSLRAMGLYCLVKCDREKALPTLEKHFADKDDIYVLAYGCVGRQMALGDFAEMLAWDPGCLEYDRENRPAPLMAKADMIRRGVKVIARGTPAVNRGLCISRLSSLTTEDPSLLDLAQLCRENTDIPAAHFIRAIGALYTSEPIRKFLIRCVDDRSLDDSAMVEVARGLMRYPNHRDARVALAQVKEAVRKKAQVED